MKTVLITGFEPFGGESVNPSWEVFSGLDNAIIGGCRVVARQLHADGALGGVDDGDLLAGGLIFRGVESHGAPPLFSATRTAGGRKGGKLKDWHPVDLGAVVLNDIIDRTGADPALVEDVVIRVQTEWEERD